MTESSSQGRSKIEPSARPWLIAVIAFLPMLLVYVLHFAAAGEGTRGTGFLQSDQPSYMSMALRHFEGQFWPTYGLPYSADYNTPRVYFQLIILLLGIVTTFSGLDPGVAFTIFGIVAGVTMFRIAVALLDVFCPDLTGRAGILTIVAFLWGGGMLALSGGSWALARGLPLSYWHLRDVIFAADPNEGYWFLNLGRNVFMPLEAYYHCLFFGSIIALVGRCYALALTLFFIVLVSHPFTGLELGLVIGAFLFLESALGIDRPPRWMLVSVPILVMMIIVYYIVLLDRWSEEHISVITQSIQAEVPSSDQRYSNLIPWYSSLAAYFPVGALAAWRLWRSPSISTLLRQREIRLLIVWFAVCFALINHDVIVKPYQPAHFTRGYVWTPLALMAAPVVYDMFAWFLARSRTWLSAGLTACALGFILSDNVAWFGRLYLNTLALGHTGWSISLRADTEAVFRRLSADDMHRRLLVSNDEWLAYLAITYTKLRTWASHPHTTPYFQRHKKDVEDFFGGRKQPPDWDGRNMVVVLNRETDAIGAHTFLIHAGYQPVDRIGRYDIFLRDTTTTPEPR